MLNMDRQQAKLMNRYKDLPDLFRITGSEQGVIPTK